MLYAVIPHDHVLPNGQSGLLGEIFLGKAGEFCLLFRRQGGNDVAAGGGVDLDGGANSVPVVQDQGRDACGLCPDKAGT